ncbi:MAG: hypothetical protein JKX71_10400 [Amylibacter sp.]|nr:hypothetical protein [Amylibacter sp.]
MSEAFSVEAIEQLFTRKDGSYSFARWGRPIAPVVFGVDDETLPHLKDAIAQTVAVTGGTLAETDPEFGANFMWFFCTEWDEVAAVPDLEKLVPDLPSLVNGLNQKNVNEHRMFIFDKDGSIKMCLLFLRMKGAVAGMTVQALGAGETLQSLLTWGEDAFSNQSPIAVLKENGICIVKPEFAALVRGAYDPIMPAAAIDASHALRLHARADRLYRDMMQ